MSAESATADVRQLARQINAARDQLNEAFALLEFEIRERFGNLVCTGGHLVECPPDVVHVFLKDGFLLVAVNGSIYELRRASVRVRVAVVDVLPALIEELRSKERR